MPLILGIDPGGTGGHTGAVLLEHTRDNPPELVTSWAVPGDMDSFREWWQYEFSRGLSTMTVVCEMFVNRNKPGADLTPMLFEGAVRYLVPDVVLQPAAGKNTAVPDRALVNLGFSKDAFKGDHHGDRWEALRHVIWYIRKQDHVPTLRKGWPRDGGS